MAPLSLSVRIAGKLFACLILAALCACGQAQPPILLKFVDPEVKGQVIAAAMDIERQLAEADYICPPLFILDGEGDELFAHVSGEDRECGGLHSPSRRSIWVPLCDSANMNYLITVHELLHALGLGHDDQFRSVMNPSVRGDAEIKPGHLEFIYRQHCI